MSLATPQERYDGDATWRDFVEALIRQFAAYERGEIRPPWEIVDACRLAAHRHDPRRWPEPD